MSKAEDRSGGGVAGARTVKLVRQRVGVFANGAPVGERRQPRRSVHVVDIEADLDAPDGVNTYCGAHYVAGTLVEVPWGTMEPHKGCGRLAPLGVGVYGFDPVRRELVPASQIGIKAAIKAAAGAAHDGGRDEVRDGIGNDGVAGARPGGDVFTDSRVSIRVTAQWSVNDPVVYVHHTVDRECVDLAVSGPGESDVIAHFELTNPLAVLTAGHNLIDAGLSLAKKLGVDIDQLKAATPSSWWDREPVEPDEPATGETAT